MNCKQYQDELLLSFPDIISDAQVLTHLESCEDCKKFYQSLGSLSSQLGTDDDFVPQDIDVKMFVSGVIKEIDSTPKTILTSTTWFRTLAAAAAIVMMFGVSSVYKTFIENDSVTDITYADAMNNYIIAYNSDYADVTDEDEDQLDDELAGILLDDFSELRGFEAGELLLDGIDEQELKYLEENFDVMELL